MHGGTQVLARSVLIAIATFIALRGAHAQERWIRLAMGQYTSRIDSGGAMQPALTNLEITPAGGIVGDYWFNQDGRRFDGFLDNCRAVRSHVIACRWRDAFGKGTLEMSFARDLVSFRGRWNADMTPKKWLPWHGDKQPSS